MARRDPDVAIITKKGSIMSVVINTNSAATNAAMNLNNSNSMLQKSLARLSSGSKIVNPADDAGGLAVSMRMSAAIKRTDAANTNVANATSFLQTQDGALATAGKVLDRISELKTLSTDVTKTTTDTANYDKEFKALKDQLDSLGKEKFNGVDLFKASTNDTGLSVKTSEDGTQSQSVSQADMKTAVSSIAAATSLDDLDTVTDISQAITDVAAMRAQNGAEASNLGFASDMLSTNKTNLEAANSRIIDVDVAQESTQMAKNNILVQAGASMLAQANSSSQVAMKLLQ
ncbi:MAG: flagellin [Chthoniobacteraceae bacterium]|nr:flagellin [Chthoniobacteraceae bacterium]